VGCDGQATVREAGGSFPGFNQKILLFFDQILKFLKIRITTGL
jgi:hypothetical protein